MGNEWIAACGLNCETCNIRLIPFDDKACEGCAEWFREMGWLEPEEGKAEILERGMYCRGCKGDRSVHWSVDDDGTVDCWILDCCIDQKGLAFCSECAEFPCERLTDWSKKSEEYAAAFGRLQTIRAGSDGTPE